MNTLCQLYLLKEKKINDKTLVIKLGWEVRIVPWTGIVSALGKRPGDLGKVTPRLLAQPAFQEIGGRGWAKVTTRSFPALTFSEMVARAKTGRR